jgi:hypothetical protein
MKASKIKKNLKKNSIFLSICFFIFYRCYFIVTLFKERAVLPEPDDSYFYLTEIKKIIEAGTIFHHFPIHPFWSYDWAHVLPYKLAIVFLNKISSLSLPTLFYLIFFLGTFLLPFVLYFFISKLVKQKENIAWLIFFLAFYSGSGAYHGFYWVTPSFFTDLIFFIFLAKIYDNKAKKLSTGFLFLLLPVFILSHPTAVFALSILGFNLVYLFLLDKKEAKKIYLKTFFLMLFGFFQYILLQLLLKLSKTQVAPPYALPFENLGRFILNKISLDTWLVVKREYFSILFPHPFFWLVFLVLIFCLIKKRRFKILSLFLATLTYTLFALMNEYGFRALEFHWPATFLVLGQGIFDFYQQLKKVPRLLFLGLILFFLIVLNIFNNIQVRSLNQRDNFSWDESCALYLLKKTGENDLVFYENGVTYSVFAFYGLYKREARLINLSQIDEVKNQAQGNFLVMTKQEVSGQPEEFSRIEKFLIENISRKGQQEKLFRKEGGLLENFTLYENLKFERDCGYFQIYKIL